MGMSKAQKAEKLKKQKAAEKQAYNNAYNKQNYLCYSFRLNKESEFKYISHLAQQTEGLKPYLISLIEKDMKAQRRRMRVADHGEEAIS